MLREGLYDRLSAEERAVLKLYDERVAQCRERLKTGDSEDTSNRPLAILPTHELSQVPGFPGSATFTVESEPPGKHSTPRHSSFRSSRVSSRSGTPRRGQYAEATYSSRRRSKSPTAREGSRKSGKRLDLHFVPNLEAEVGKLLRIVYRYSKKSSKLRETLSDESRLFRLYASRRHARN